MFKKSKKPDGYGYVISSAMLLKRCPFCGDTVHITYSTFGEDKIFYVRHDSKTCILNNLSIEDKNINTVEAAYEAWNRREGVKD